MRSGEDAPAPDRPACTRLSAGESRYLLGLLELERGTEPATQAQLARHLDVSQPSTTEMIRRLRQLGLLEPGALRLSSAGTSAALVLWGRRLAAQRLTQDVLGLDAEQARVEAERLATSASPAFARGLVAWGASTRRAAR